MKCGFCQSSISKQLTLQHLFSFEQVVDNACCESCYFDIEKVNKEFNCCQYCQKILGSETKICSDCQSWLKEKKNFNLMHDYLYIYNEKMKEYFQSYKFIGDIRMSQVFSGDIRQKLVSYQKQGFIIIPIPVSDDRLKERGFNQVEKLLESSLIDYEPILLKKETSSGSQSEKSKVERLKTEQSFFIKDRNKKKVRRKKVLLIDDVYTTGRTILHAYDCVLVNKPDEIRSFSLSR